MNPINNLLSQFIKRNQLAPLLNKHRAVAYYNSMKEPSILLESKADKVMEDKLVILVPNSIVASEINHYSTYVLREINNHIGMKIVYRIHFQMTDSLELPRNQSQQDFVFSFDDLEEEDRLYIESELSPITDPKLKENLLKLYCAVLMRSD